MDILLLKGESSVVQSPKNPDHLEVSPWSILKMIAVLGAAYAFFLVFKIWLLLFLGFLLAVSLEPIALKIQSWGVRRNFAIALIAGLMASGILAIFIFVIPSMFDQVRTLIAAAPTWKQKFLEDLPQRGPIQLTAGQMLNNPKIPEASVLMANAVSFLNVVAEVMSEFFLVLIFSVYLLVDGKRAFKWITDFFSAPTRLKLQATAKQTSPVIYGYVAGQLITCLLSGLVAYLTLTMLKVPAALTLGVLAGVMDILPILGFVAAVIPAVLLALTVSPSVAGVVALVYITYHAIENYLLVPLIYGSSMKLSSLIVLLSLLVAGSTCGVLGALAILPVVASYPIIERIWLVKYLGRRVIVKHAEMTEPDKLPDQVTLWNEKPIRTDRPISALSGHQMSKTYGKKVLVVEDDPDIRSMLQEILETEGYITLIAANGKEGFEVLRRHFDVGLILLDLMMPVMDGRTFFEKVKKMDGFANIPVVFLSGSIDKVNTQGAAGVLQKPTDIDHVLDIVDEHYSFV